MVIIATMQAGSLSVGQLKILQEVITLAVLVPFAWLYLKEPPKLDYLWAAQCISCSAVAGLALRTLVAIIFAFGWA